MLAKAYGLGSGGTRDPEREAPRPPVVAVPTARQGQARATERHREDLLLAAVANVVGHEEAARLTTLALNEAYPGERPEDEETPRQRELRDIEDPSLPTSLRHQQLLELL